MTSSKNSPRVDWQFAVPIYSQDVEGASEHRQGLIDLIQKKQAESPGLKKSNKNGWHSEIDAHLWGNEHIKWLNEQIGTFSIECIKNANKDIKKFDVAIASCWANVSGHGAWNSPHCHYPHNWSGIFYVQVENTLDTNNPQDPNGKIEFLNPVGLASAFDMPTGITYIPRDGLIFLFPSALEHLVHPNLTDNLRISIAFNLNVIKKEG